MSFIGAGSGVFMNIRHALPRPAFHSAASAPSREAFRRFPAGKTALAAASALLLLAAPSTAPAFSAAADNIGGYSTQVLSQILRVWRQPEGARGTAVMELRIDPSGHVTDCAILQASASPGADASVCTAAHNAAPYPFPPFNAEARVSLAMAYGPGDGSASNAPAPSYAEMLRQSIAPHIIMPHGLSGSWTTVVQLDVWADGTMRDCRISRPSGNADVDAAVMAAVRTPGVIPVPPEHAEQRVTLSFTLSASR